MSFANLNSNEREGAKKCNKKKNKAGSVSVSPGWVGSGGDWQTAARIEILFLLTHCCGPNLPTKNDQQTQHGHAPEKLKMDAEKNIKKNPMLGRAMNDDPLQMMVTLRAH